MNPDSVPHLPFSPAAERNKQPILDRLRTLLPVSGVALEIASGTGQHAIWFAAGLPDWSWQPTDFEAGALPVIAARVAHARLGNVHPPLQPSIRCDLLRQHAAHFPLDHLCGPDARGSPPSDA
jgi:methylase of polypeptide subunit release factors